MRYYTMEYQELLQKEFTGWGIRKVPDKKYSDKEIRTFFAEELKKYIKQDEKDYNTEPLFLDLSDSLQEDTFDPEDWLMVNEETGKTVRPSSAAEVREHLEAEQKAILEAFRNRPPFDPSESEAVFRQMWRSKLRHAASWYPEWVGQTVDRRLLALDIMPVSAFDRLKKEGRENSAKLKRIQKAAEKDLGAQVLPPDFPEELYLHDNDVLSFRKQGKDYVMLLRKDGGWDTEEGYTYYQKLIFKNARLLEKTPGLTIRTHLDDEGIMASNCIFLYSEVYTASDEPKRKGIYHPREGMEFHMLLTTVSGKYFHVTAACSSLEREDNIEL